MKKICLLFFWLSLLFVSVANAAYSSDEKAAYTWAFNKWITTKSTIDQANMKWDVTRIELAKMISNYAINTLKKEKDTSKKCVFVDVTGDLDLQYDKWVTNVCQLWLMWQWIMRFRPYDKVTEAEFWAILSRLLYWSKFDWWNPFYLKHIYQLYLIWITSNIIWVDKVNEKRGNVMIMLKRASDLWNKVNNPAVSFSELSDKTPLKCTYQSIFAEGWDFQDSVYKKYLLLPYKDWYFSFTIAWQDWYDVNIDYRLANDLCHVRLRSDAVFRFRSYHSEDSTIKLYNFENSYDAVDSNLVKTLNCDSSNSDWCANVIKQYVYNLFIWKESNEKFTSQLNKLKKKVDNGEFNAHLSNFCEDCHFID